MDSRVALDRRKWEELYATGARPDRSPSAWIVSTLAALPNELSLLDVAGGSGRHAVPAAQGGRSVTLVDFVERAVTRARQRARIDGVVAEVARLPFRTASFGIVLVTNFLARSLLPVFIDLLAPGGFLLYETYTTDHQSLVERGLARGPTSAEFLLRPGELRGLVDPLTVVEYWEGEVDDAAGRRCCARLLAQRETAS
ncbi:MAG TPA: class I SAM-dependent methyltransferase [Gemmatimonadaceae bacterium]